MSSPFLSPELMVIGDSLAQGCRSMSVSKRLCSQSYASQATGVLGLTFDAPEHPYPVIFELEELIRDYVNPWLPVDVAPLLFHLENNLNAWRTFFQSPQPSYPDYYNNLAVAGATLADITGLKYGDSLATINSLKSFTFLELWKISLGDVGALHKAINSAFVLNPSGKPEFPPLKPILFTRLLGMAYVALVVGYFYGLKTALSGGHPREVAMVGLVSNLGAFLILCVFGFRGSWAAWGGWARAVMWFSVFATGWARKPRKVTASCYRRRVGYLTLVQKEPL